MKKIVFTLAAILSLGTSLAQAEGAGRALNSKNLECHVTLDNREKFWILTPIVAIGETVREVGPASDKTTITVRQASGNISVSAVRGSSSEQVQGQLSQGYMQGKSGNLKVVCLN